MRITMICFIVIFILSCTESSTGPDEENTVMDIDGNVYNTIQIGDQLWMVENLKVTHYRNGDSIPEVIDDEYWISTNESAYCVFDNIPSNSDTYGNLYNWYAVTDLRGLAPEGWHIPSDEEIMELEMYLGMTYNEAHNGMWRGTNEGSKLAGRLDLWVEGDLVNDNEFGSSGFIFLPGGYRECEGGDFMNISASALLYTFTEFNNDRAWLRNVNYYITGVSRYTTPKQTGLSVRCVKN